MDKRDLNGVPYTRGTVPPQTPQVIKTRHKEYEVLVLVSGVVDSPKRYRLLTLPWLPS